jgi:hypothetical protein
MKKLNKIKPTPVINKTYEISWRDPVVANTIAEAYDQIKSILENLKKLVQWEQEGKISAECGDSSPSFQCIVVLDASIEPELQKIGIVSFYQIDDEEV